jgi:hypothetical protein
VQGFCAAISPAFTNQKPLLSGDQIFIFGQVMLIDSIKKQKGKVKNIAFLHSFI